MADISCFLPIFKLRGETSFTALKRVKKVLSPNKIGHAGTLDPFAEGLLIAMLGKYTRFFDLLQQLPKLYTGEICLGKATDTLDITGKLVEEREIAISNPAEFLALLNAKIKAKFFGKITQLTPATSAAKYKGKPLYYYFRKGIEVPVKKRKVQIYSFEITDLLKKNEDYYCKFSVECSSGTYVRVLLYDLLSEFDIPSVMVSLRREKIGPITLDRACKMEELNTEVKDFYLSLEDVFSVGAGVVTSKALNKARNGNILLENEIKVEQEGSYYLLFSESRAKIGYFLKEESKYKVMVLCNDNQ